MVMNIAFSTIPSNYLVPGVGAEIDNSQANTDSINQRTLVLGQILSAGSATPNVPFLAVNQAQVNTACGTGSMLALMYQTYRAADPTGETWLLPLADNAGGVAGSTTLTITGTSTSVTTLNCYVQGVNQQVLVNLGDTAAVTATNLAAAINDNNPVMMVTATAVSGVVTITSRHKGAAAGDIDVRLNYLGALNGEATPPGLTFAVAAGTVGSADPLPDTGLANCGSQTYDYICSALSNSEATSALISFLSDTSGGRWSYLQELFGQAFNAVRGTASALQTFGAANNSQHVATLGFYDSPTPAWQVVAGWVAIVATSLRADPGLTLTDVVLPMAAPPVQSRFSDSIRNTLLYSGISTFTVNPANQVVLERCVENYQYNLSGAPDNSYRDVETLACLTAYLRDLIQDLKTKFGRCKLAPDGSQVGYGSNLVTSQTIKNEIISQYQRNVNVGIVVNPEAFAKGVSAENQGNGRVAVALPVALIGQLRRIDLQCIFTKP